LKGISDFFTEPYEAENGWEFYVSDGKDGIAFQRSFDGEDGHWEAKLFTGQKPPDVFQSYDESKITFHIWLTEKVPPLKPESLTPELADSVKKATRLAKLLARTEPVIWLRLDGEAKDALKAAAQGRMRTEYMVQPVFFAFRESLYYGDQEFPVWVVSSSGPPKAWDRIELVRLPNGFIATWNDEYLPSAAFQLKDGTLTLVPQWKPDNLLSASQVQIDMAEMLSQFIKTAQCARLLAPDEMKLFEGIVHALKTKKPRTAPERYYKYINELYVQLEEGPENAPPKEVRGNSSILSKEVIETDTAVLSYDVYSNGYWSMSLFKTKPDKKFSTVEILKPDGISSGYIGTSGEGSNMLGYSSTRVSLRHLPSNKGESIVNETVELARKALASEEVRSKAPDVIKSRLGQIVQRKMCVIESFRYGSVLYETISAGDGEMMYELNVPEKALPRITMRIVGDVVAIDQVKYPVEVYPNLRSLWQVRFQDGKLRLITAQGSQDPTIIPKLKNAVETITKLDAAGLISIPDFAKKQCDQFVSAIKAASKFDEVITKPSAEIVPLVPGIPR
jgi:hypothetical protein